MRFVADTERYLEKHPEARDHKCAQGRRHWDCHWCGAATPVGFSHCPDDLECMVRMRNHINALENLVASLLDRQSGYCYDY